MVPGPTALVAASHNIALGTLKAIRDSGLQIPDDISVAGFDEWSVRLTEHPSLTVAEQAPYEIGQKAAELLIARISGQRSGEAQEIVLPSRVVYRDSCGPRPGV
jgi:LacI family transcriptional regulator